MRNAPKTTAKRKEKQDEKRGEITGKMIKSELLLISNKKEQIDEQTARIWNKWGKLRKGRGTVRWREAIPFIATPGLVGR